ncbi:very-short-patch-repair endonuclease/ribosomal protein L29 [Virgibacillus natechei]|uniref:Very-short-patch-repair endonuclease/ribosomal protein L29 n=1 Tax=Virgibacillus natechei TaxID=1216297 RepID=A0ABS4IK71_9BACI|nr:AAA domain-containing protein [Virgibacillus natechei]MBP1971358.1 very-short-patch-repair endonuclease/ribosomal protein L29 [Virgibacillus natechei]UZD12264.1 AAA domain-containing protein [Virgibacillus natechei]
MSEVAETTDVAKIFEYLLAVKNLNEKTILSVQQYEKVWWVQDFPNLQGCYVGGGGEVEDAWLEVHKQKITSAPTPPVAISEWVKHWDKPSTEPIKVVQIYKGIDQDNGQEIFEKFTDDEERVSKFEEWLEEKWRPWAKEMRPKLEIQKVYDQLFATHQQLQREMDDIEIAWGHGLLNWQVNGEKIQRHVLVTKLELQFQPKRGLFALIPTTKGTELETDMLPTNDVPNMSRIMEMEGQVKEADLDPWNVDSMEPFFKEIAHTISPYGSYIKQTGKPSITNNPLITYTPAIFLRKSGNRLWQKELETAIEKVENGYPVPNSIKLLTANGEVESQPEPEAESGRTTKKEWQGVGEQLLFPLPTNNAQKLIATKLSNNDGVLVQGPPGTGKSHTIANLISHLLAHGKRVLVTSEKERALQVLRDKIPEEIRALVVSVLGGDSRSVKEIEDSIKFIAENLDSQQPETLEKNIQGLEKELDQTKRNIARINTEINQTAEAENTPITIESETYTPLEASKWLNENSTHGWIPDRITLNDDFPLHEDETKEFFKLHGIIKGEDRKLLSKNQLATRDIVQPDVFEKAVSQVKSTEQDLKPYENVISDWDVKDLTYHFNIEEKVKLVEKSMRKLAVIQEETWRSLLLKEILGDAERQDNWSDFHKNVYDEVRQIEAIDSDLIAEEIVIPENVNHTILKEDLEVIKQRLEDNKSIGWMFKNILGRKYSYIFEQCKINGLEIRHKQDVEKILKYTDGNILIQKLVLKWNRTMNEYQGPTIDENQKRMTTTVKQLLDDMGQMVRWEKDIIHELDGIRDEIVIPRKPQWDSMEWFTTLKNGLTAIYYQQQLKQANTIFNTTTDTLAQANAKSGNMEIVDALLTACHEKDVALWKESWNELKRLEELNESFHRYKELHEKIEKMAPLWLEQLEEQGGQGEAMYPPEDLRLAWKWKKLSTWIEDIESKSTIEKLEEDLQLETNNESKIIKQLVATSTWKSQIERTTKEQKRSLFAWLKAIQRVGKGTGKYANVYRKEASKEMATARGAIPVWIMPIKSVIENLDLTADQFDVVIVDESSQSNLFSLSALLRGKKAVIVGDDNQISPESVGTDIGETHGLIDRYLNNIPNKLQFEMKTSLYDTASRVFDSKIILKEHFRCVPEIIQFSNDFMYGGMIDPLRLPLGNEALDPPVKAIRVADGYRKEDSKKAINEPEAEAIVEEIARLCKEEQYANKTFGVISLQGYDQANIIENKLREAIGEEEMINRQIICGDAYSFQGDERDVIFMSLVAAPNMRIGPMTGRSAYQRFNVAASRARDQMLLFHSVELNDLNPECARYRLLQYCKEPYRVQQEIDEVQDEFDSKFEEDVFRLIKARGYRVIPQVKVGTLGKRIDLVVEGMRNRLAVECDGDRWHGLDKWEEDIERQRVLERVGWTFWRIRGSQFYLDREKALEPLWKKLDEMGIQPGG